MDQNAVFQRLLTFEGSIPYMYRCTGGEVTIGIGHAILNAALAQPLSWNIGGAVPSPAQIATDYNTVNAAAKGLPAPHYEPMTTCRMSNDAIRELALADIASFTAQLENALPNWNNYPDCVQQALFDMGFNLGIAGLLKFQHLLAACNAADWATAAAQCHRIGISEARNAATAALFQQALKS